MMKKLSKNEIIKLCDMYRSGDYSQRHLATYFETSTYTVNRIIRKYNAKPNKIDRIKLEFKSAGYKLITKEYVNRDEQLEYICPKHGLQSISYKSFKNGSRCKACHNELISTPFEVIHAFFTKKGFILLTKESDYVNSKSKLEYMCKKHGKKTTSWGSFKHTKYGCHECYLDSIRIDFNDIKHEFEKVGYTLLSTKNDFINSKEKLKYLCPIHGLQYINWSNFKQGQRCPECDIDARKKDWHDVKQAFKNEGYQLISKKYVNSYSKLEYICPKHGIQETTWRYFNLGSRCPECAIENHKGYFNINRGNLYKDEWEKIKAYVYCVKITIGNEGFYKIGITTNTTHERMYAIPCDHYEIIDEIKTNLFQAVYIEYNILSRFKAYKYIPSIIFNGSTECIDLKVKNIKEIFEEFKLDKKNKS